MVIDRSTPFETLPDIATPEECADYLGLHVKTVLEYIREGKIRAAKCGTRYRIRRQWILDFLDESSKQA